jgi:hypothetical protein
VLIADSVVKHSYDLCPISHIIIAAVPGHLRMMKLAGVAVSVTERGYCFALKEAESEFSLEYSIRIVENTETMHFSSLEFTLVVELSVRAPPEFTLSVVLTVLKLAFVSVVVSPVDFTMTMENVCHKFTLVDRFSAWNLIVGTFRIDPHQFAVSLHARVNKFSNVVTTIGPFEFALPLNS